MNQGFSKFIAFVFHPVFINLLNLWLLFNLFPSLSHGIPLRVQLFYISFIFISTSIIPIITVFVLRFTGKVNSIMLHLREERKMPYLVTMLLYFFNYYNFTKYPTHPLILSYLLACAAVVGLVMVFNFYTKISIHLATLGALAGLLAVASQYSQFDLRLLLVLSILLSGFVASARLSSNAHQPKEVYSGFVLGFVLMFFIL